jgi:PrtD family type I secretion system ABC transporter
MQLLTHTTRKKKPANELDQAIAHCRSAFGTVAVFSAVINVLMLSQPIYMLQVYDRVLTTGHYETLIALTVITALGLAALCALDGLRTAVTMRVGEWLHSQLSPVYLAASVRAQLAGKGAGAQPLRDLSQIQSFIGTQGLNVFFDLPWVPFFVALIWLLHPVLGVTALVSALLLLGLGVLNELATRSANVTASARQIEAVQHAEATVRNAEAVSSMGMLPAMIEHWRRMHGAGLACGRRSGEIGTILISFTKFVRFFVQVAILGLGAMLVLDGKLTAGSMIAASILLGRALAPVEVAISAWRNFSSARIAYGRLKSHLEAFPTQEPRMLLPAPAGSISVEKLSYVSPDTGTVILRHVTFATDPGQIIAVIGPSGAGKSTLCRFLVGLQQPTAGKIRIDGSDIRHWDPLQLGRHIGYLPQDVELFAGNVRDNIARMGECRDEHVVEAAALAHAHEIIQRLPHGYDTQIGERGAKLSGGQRQRIGLARAIYGDPRVIVLDEPNANLDQAGEAALAAALGELKARGAAILVVGHRPSTLARADKILLLKDGQVEMFGPRDEVLQKLRMASSAASRNGEIRERVVPASADGGTEGRTKFDGGREDASDADQLTALKRASVS